MRTLRHPAGTRLLLAFTGVLVGVLAGCGLHDTARDVANSAQDQAVTQVRNACDRALLQTEESLQEQGSARVDQLARELARNLPSTYRDAMASVAGEIEQTAQDRNLGDALSSAAPAEARQEWHEMAVDICTERVLAQAGSVVGS